MASSMRRRRPFYVLLLRARKLETNVDQKTIRNYLALAFRLPFTAFYFGVGANSFVRHRLGDPQQELAESTTALEVALANSHFMNLLITLCCLFGGGALLFRRTTPLGIVIVAPLVVVIFFFHLIATKDWWWGTLNLLWLTALVWQYRRGFYGLWRYS